jgi:hypothetical protein
MSEIKKPEVQPHHKQIASIIVLWLLVAGAWQTIETVIAFGRMIFR